MKELSIEQKAKRYDEALKEAVIAHKDEDRHLKATLERIFPELKESEDKKIKKEIISHLKYLGKYCQESMPNVNEWITWIEKQGEQKPVDKVEPKFKVKYAGNEYNVFEVKDIAGVTYYGIEDEPNHIDYVLPDNCEIVSEQKLADMVEPKFKAGDWIVRELDNSVHQVKAVIENISNGKYGYDLTKGGYISSQDANFYHHWTIQDAKDGDVLQLGLVTAIFQEYIGNGNCKCYCSICGEFDIPSQEGDDNSYGCSDAAPATKEQRDILLNAIYEAGYTFDFEKKELKKIEQKPAEIIPKFKVGDWIVNNDNGCINKVTEIRDDEYCLWPLDAKIMGYLRIIDIDNDYHLWTIQDAKDGDVIVCPKYAGDIVPNIFIFKGITVKDNDVICHCFFSKAFIGTECYIANADSINTDFYPATKEQRNTLFKAMTDAGYTFDFEKKVIKKRN